MRALAAILALPVVVHGTLTPTNDEYGTMRDTLLKNATLSCEDAKPLLQGCTADTPMPCHYTRCWYKGHLLREGQQFCDSETCSVLTCRDGVLVRTRPMQCPKGEVCTCTKAGRLYCAETGTHTECFTVVKSGSQGMLSRSSAPLPATPETMLNTEVVGLSSWGCPSTDLAPVPYAVKFPLDGIHWRGSSGGATVRVQVLAPAGTLQMPDVRTDQWRVFLDEKGADTGMAWKGPPAPGRAGHSNRIRPMRRDAGADVDFQVTAPFGDLYRTLPGTGMVSFTADIRIGVSNLRSCHWWLHAVVEGVVVRVPMVNDECCYRAGHWYPDGTVLAPGSETGCRECTCDQGTWLCRARRLNFQEVAPGRRKHGQLLAYAVALRAMRSKADYLGKAMQDDALTRAMLGYGTMHDDIRDTSMFLPWNRVFLHDMESEILDAWMNIRDKPMILLRHGWPRQSSPSRDIRRDRSVGDPAQTCPVLPYLDLGMLTGAEGVADLGFFNTGEQCGGAFAEYPPPDLAAFPEWNETTCRTMPSQRHYDILALSAQGESCDDAGMARMASKAEHWLGTWAHGSLGGPMSTRGAAFDPIFAPLHAFIDRVWTKYQTRCKDALAKLECNGYTPRHHNSADTLATQRAGDQVEYPQRAPDLPLRMQFPGREHFDPTQRRPVYRKDCDAKVLPNALGSFYGHGATVRSSLHGDMLGHTCSTQRKWQMRGGARWTGWGAEPTCGREETLSTERDNDSGLSRKLCAYRTWHWVLVKECLGAVYDQPMLPKLSEGLPRCRAGSATIRKGDDQIAQVSGEVRSAMDATGVLAHTVLVHVDWAAGEIGVGLGRTGMLNALGVRCVRTPTCRCRMAELGQRAANGPWTDIPSTDRPAGCSIALKSPDDGALVDRLAALMDTTGNLPVSVAEVVGDSHTDRVAGAMIPLDRHCDPSSSFVARPLRDYYSALGQLHDVVRNSSNLGHFVGPLGWGQLSRRRPRVIRSKDMERSPVETHRAFVDSRRAHQQNHSVDSFFDIFIDAGECRFTEGAIDLGLTPFEYPSAPSDSGSFLSGFFSSGSPETRAVDSFFDVHVSSSRLPPRYAAAVDGRRGGHTAPAAESPSPHVFHPLTLHSQHPMTEGFGNRAELLKLYEICEKPPALASAGSLGPELADYWKRVGGRLPLSSTALKPPDVSSAPGTVLPGGLHAVGKIDWSACGTEAVSFVGAIEDQCGHMLEACMRDGDCLMHVLCLLSATARVDPATGAPLPKCCGTPPALFQDLQNHCMHDCTEQCNGGGQVQVATIGSGAQVDPVVSASALCAALAECNEEKCGMRHTDPFTEAVCPLRPAIAEVPARLVARQSSAIPYSGKEADTVPQPLLRCPNYFETDELSLVCPFAAGCSVSVLNAHPSMPAPWRRCSCTGTCGGDTLYWSYQLLDFGSRGSFVSVGNARVSNATFVVQPVLDCSSHDEYDCDLPPHGSSSFGNCLWNPDNGRCEYDPCGGRCAEVVMPAP